MGILSWIFYVFLGVVFFVVISVLDNKYKLSKTQSFVFSLLFIMIVAGFCLRFGLNCYDNIFLSFVFLMISDIVYSSYFVEKDFFDKSEKNVLYYFLLIFVGFIINQEFFNEVDTVFLTGNDFRYILWFIMFIFLYSFFREKNVMNDDRDKKNNNMSLNSILNCYARYKYIYFDECNMEDKNLSNALYAIMIYEGNTKSKLFRNIDNFLFRIDGKSRKLGIMQVESKKFISDSESIEIVRKKIEKIYSDKKKCKDINALFDKYFGYDNEAVKNIFEIIKKM